MDNNLEGKNLQKQPIAILEMDEDGISAPNWLFEVLAWISRIEMANSQLSFSCKLFKQLCWPKLHETLVEPHKIEQLKFRGDWRNNSGYLLRNTNGQPLPIPNAPPSYIIGCKRIYISFLNEQILEILKNILPLLNQIKFFVEMQFIGWAPKDYRTYSIWCLLDLLAHKIVKLKFCPTYRARVSEFNLLFPGILQKVDYLCACPIPEEFDSLFNWLAMPTKNGENQQKILELEQSDENDMDKFVDRLKKEFSNATKPLNFFIICPLGPRIAQFNKNNWKTRESLTTFTYRYRMERTKIYNLIVRCPNGKKNYWNEEGKRKMRKFWENEDENETNIVLQSG